MRGRRKKERNSRLGQHGFSSVPREGGVSGKGNKIMTGAQGGTAAGNGAKKKGGSKYQQKARWGQPGGIDSGENELCGR